MYNYLLLEISQQIPNIINTNIWVYLGISTLIIFIGIIINYFFNKFNKIVNIQDSLNKTLIKLEVLITKFNNHIDAHIDFNKNSTERRNFCDKRYDTIDYQIKELEKSIEKLKNKN